MRDDGRRVVKVADQLAIRALATDGATLDGDVIRAGIAQLGAILGDALLMSGATEAEVTFGLEVDADLGAVVVVPADDALLEVTLEWDTDDLVLMWEDDEEIDDLDDDADLPYGFGFDEDAEDIEFDEDDEDDEDDDEDYDDDLDEDDDEE
ncbi:MAG: CU044_2847 family protein [Acidimicrobiia bacterium]